MTDNIQYVIGVFNTGRYVVGVGNILPLTIPAAPSNLQASTVSDTEIDLTWIDNSLIEDNIIVQRSTDAVNYSTIDTLPADSTSYSDTGLSGSTPYYYRVYAQNAAGDSDYSNVATATTDATTLVLDTFADTNGTPLATHTPNIDVAGGGWIGGSGLTIENNRVQWPSFSNRSGDIDCTTAIRRAQADMKRVGSQSDRFFRIQLSEDLSGNTYGELKGDEVLKIVADNVTIASKTYNGIFDQTSVFTFEIIYDDVNNEITLNIYEDDIQTDTITASHVMIPQYAGFFGRLDTGAWVDDFEATTS